MPTSARDVIIQAIEGDMVEALPWHKLMCRERYDEVLTLGAYAFGMSLHEVEAQAGPLMPPHLITCAFVHSWLQAGLSVPRIPQQYYSSNIGNYVDQLHFVAELARVSSYFTIVRSKTPERAQAAMSVLKELSMAHQYEVGQEHVPRYVKLAEIRKLRELQKAPSGALNVRSV